MRKILLLVLIILLLIGECCFAAPAKKPVVKKAVAKDLSKGDGKDVAKDVAKDLKKEKPRSEIKYTGFDSKRDPFSPPEMVVKLLEKPDNLLGEAAKNIKLPKIELQGIIWSKNTPQVIVNGGVMKVGEFIEEFEIKEIQRTGIVLFYKGNDYFVKMVAYTPKNVKKKKR